MLFRNLEEVYQVTYKKNLEEVMIGRNHEENR